MGKQAIEGDKNQRGKRIAEITNSSQGTLGAKIDTEAE